MSFIAPLSPPDEHVPARPSSSKAHPGGGRLADPFGDHLLGPPRTVDRKRNGLRKTRTEPSLPTPPRTRERVGRSSTSPDGAGSSATTRRRATSSSSQPFSLPADQPVDGLYAAPTIESSSSRTASSTAAAFGALSPPLTGSTRSKKRHPAHRQVDSLGPTRRAALKGGYVSVDWKAPHPPAFESGINGHAHALPPLPTAAEVAAARLEKLRRNRDPTKGPIWEDGNPFLEGMGLRAKGLVSDKQRVGSLEEKETIGYVFRGTKTVFANPFYTGEHGPIVSDPTGGASELDMAHPDFTPVANPPPRLLFPALGRGGHKASSTSASARSRSRGSAANADEDDDDELEMQAVPRRLFSGGQPAGAGVEMDDDDDDESDEMDVELSPDDGGRRGRATAKRPLDAFGGPVDDVHGQTGRETAKRRRLSTGLHV